ncbi:Glycoside hydrolase, family 81 [Akanthomyces lecanii RCEF 1005]|uniref:glucan endo-1,3-beta-D-glucosidase n=1 Tax=Akanthomyces lecanii RCEF 1005 TaxID=1081108 RepID=A0A162IS83_CORDF|nr:Glycoside hydrolase, family 81 [Akanthomyces lecanii RCEF 1005]
MNIASVNMLSLLSCVSLASAVVAGAVPGHYNPVGDLLRERGTFGPISTNSADGIAGGQVTCDAAPVGSFFAGLKPPFPTNSWWAPYAAPPGNATAAGPFPYESSLDGSGVLFGISTNRQFDGTSVKQPTQVDWHASFAEHNGAFANHKATSFDTQTVTVQYFQNGASMDTYLVPGSPYMTFKYTAATPLLTSGNGGIKALNGKTLAVATATGTAFTVTDTKGTVYLIYALSSITLTAKSDSSSSGTIRASGKFDGVLRLVMLANQSHKTLLDQHYKTYPTAASLDYSFGSVDGTVIFNWDTQGDGAQLLMLTWPHHRLTMQNPSFPPTSALGYLTTKGWMYPAIGNLWRMNYALSDITWNAPRPLDSSCADGVRNGLEYEVGQLNVSSAPVPGDFYYWGNTMAAQARLALIADDMGRHDLVDKVVSYLKASFEHWFQSSSSTLPAYETGWGGIINKAGHNNAYVDFGNGYYNDHHFHYGYFLNVAAVIAKYDSGWLNQHRDYINLFARDIINPSPQDPYFPVTRCRDWFAGHSWASGIANGAGSRDQESSGEAINGYYGALLWASVALSQDYVNYAKLLLASEQLAAGVYWHLDPQAGRDDRDNPYPEPEMRKLVSMGNVMDYQSGAWLFWGSQKVEIAAIQILPLTPTNEVLYDSKWVQNVWDYTMPELVDPSIGDEWKCVIIAAYANKDPQTAAEWSSKLTTWGSGNTYTNELYFIGTRPNASGRPICGALPQNPYGTFKIQSASSSKYVRASSSSPNLVASGTDAGGASTFASAYLPNAGTLQLVSSNQYVTADQSGNSTLAAARATASAWERFVVRQKVNAATGVYTIKAASNGKYVTLAGDGSLVNNAAAESAGEGFRFIKA